MELLSDTQQCWKNVLLSYKLKSFSLVGKLHEYKLKKTPNIMIFSLVLRNNSISSYRIFLEDFPFLSLLLLEKIYGRNMRMCACENILLGIPCFKPVNFKKKYFSIASLSDNNREFGFHITGCFAKKIKN